MRSLRAIALLSTLLLRPQAAPAEELLAPLSDGARLDLPVVAEQAPTPADSLGYLLGARFSHGSELLDYLEELAAASPRVELMEYGRTWEDRPLVLLAISSARNIARLEALRQGQLRLAAGLAPDETDPVVVWLSHGIHGNEPAASEAAMATAYLLAVAGGEWAELLEGIVVLIDPLANPDGRERYVHFYESRRGRQPDPLPASVEHREPWPGGRLNHYLIDLNRDWAWATQPETRSRLATYRLWEPQVFVDFHEMSTPPTDIPAATAQPINVEIGEWRAPWARRFAKAVRATFARYGWAPPGAEGQELHYPGYGDSYPSLRGAVGMTYEMVGHGRAGESLQLPQGGLLTLADRIARHLATSLTTVATAAAARPELLTDFAAARRRAGDEPAISYLWEANQPDAAAAAELLQRHGIEVRRLAGARTLPTRSLRDGVKGSRAFPGDTWVVSSSQPLGALIRTLMQPHSPLAEDSLRRQRALLERHGRIELSDVTAWSIPIAYNLETWSVPTHIAAATAHRDRGGIHQTGRLGYLAPPQGLSGYRFIAALMTAGLRFRVAVQPFSSGSRDYPAGTIYVPRVGNPAGLDGRLASLAERLAVDLDRAVTTLSSADTSLGSDRVVPVRPPRVALVGGDGVTAESYGALWHLLDRDLGLTHHRLETRTLGQTDLTAFDLIVLPSGYGYDEWLRPTDIEALGRWVERGGLLVATGGAISWLRRHRLTDIEAWQPDSEGLAAGGHAVPANRRLHTPGAALATILTDRHPLTVGLRAPPAELFVGREILLPTGDPRRDLLVASADPILAGLAWPEAADRLAGSLLVGMQPRGKGAMVLFAQEPAFRLFWRAKLPLLLNTVLLGPSLNQVGWPVGRGSGLDQSR